MWFSCCPWPHGTFTTCTLTLTCHLTFLRASFLIQAFLLFNTGCWFLPCSSPSLLSCGFLLHCALCVSWLLISLSSAHCSPFPQLEPSLLPPADDYQGHLGHLLPPVASHPLSRGSVDISYREIWPICGEIKLKRPRVLGTLLTLWQPS